MKTKTDLSSINKYLNKIILNSETYGNLLYTLTTDEKFKIKIKDAFDNDIDLFNSVIKDVEYIYYLSTILGMENDFIKCALDAVKIDSAIETVINTKFIETLYGNPFKEDISLNDILFTLLESIIGLDTIIESFKDRSLLIKKVNINMKDDGSFNALNIIFNSIYEDLKYCDNYDEIINVINSYKDDLALYIERGLNSQAISVINNPNGNFSEYDFLLERLKEILPNKDTKKM